jgi:hypothetical protein
MNRIAAVRLLVAFAIALATGHATRSAWGDFSSTPLASPVPQFGAFQPNGGAQHPAQTQPPQTPHPAIARIIVPEKDGTSYGSGTLIGVTDSQGLVITNNHVVESQSGPITVVFPDGFRSEATVLKRDETWDLAALSIWKPNVAPVSIAAVRAAPGETLAIAGYGSGVYRMVQGRCTQYVAPGPRQPFEMVELAASARQGDSGGPILNQRGELAGVLFGEGDGKTAGSDSGRVNWFLASIREPDNSNVARLTANRTETGSPPNYTANTPSNNLPTDTWRAVDPFSAPPPGSVVRDQPPGDPFASRIAPSNTSPPVPNVDPRFAQPTGAGTQANAGARWAWPGTNGPAATPPTSSHAASNANSVAPGHDVRPSYPLPESPATIATSPTAATKSQSGDIGSLLGATRFEQAKSILAIIGAIAVVVTFAKGFAKT